MNNNYLGSDLTIEELMEIRSHNVLRKNISQEITEVVNPYIGKVITAHDAKLMVDQLCDLGLFKNAQVAFGLLSMATKRLEEGIELKSDGKLMKLINDNIKDTSKLISGSENILE